MNSKTTLFLFVGAIIAGLAAAFLANSFISTKIADHKTALDKQYTSIEIVVPTKNLRKGTILDASVLAVRKVPRAFIHQDTVLPGTVADVVTHQLVHPVNKGEPLLMSHMSKSRGKGFSSLIEDGNRALTFPVDIIKSVSGMLRPGDRIDLLMTLDDNKIKKTLPLLVGVEVLATGEQVDEEFTNNEVSARYQTITLLVTSENASRIILANQAADLSVVLRSPNDNGPTFAEAMTVSRLLGKEKASTSRRRGPPRIEIIRAGKK